MEQGKERLRDDAVLGQRSPRQDGQDREVQAVRATIPHQLLLLDHQCHVPDRSQDGRRSEEVVQDVPYGVQRGRQGNQGKDEG